MPGRQGKQIWGRARRKEAPRDFVIQARVASHELPTGDRSHSLFRDDAVRADGEGDDYVVVNHEQDAVAVGHPKVEDLMAMPGDAFQFVAAERGMPPIGTEQGELGAGNTLDIGRKGFELALEPDGPPEDHRSLTMSSMESYCWGSMASSLCSLVSAKSLSVGLRAGTVAANSTGSKGTSAFVFFVLAFTTEQSSRKAAQPQWEKPLQGIWAALSVTHFNEEAAAERRTQNWYTRTQNGCR